MPPSSSVDYSQQLNSAIRATRVDLLTKHTDAHANAATAYGAYSVSRRNFDDARRGMLDAFARLSIVAYLDRKLVDAQFTADQVVKLAQNADAQAIAAQNAVTLALNSVRAATTAVEALAFDLNGVSGSAPSDRNKWLSVDQAADAAALKVKDVQTKVQNLRSDAVKASVEAARPRTNVTIQAAIDAKNKVTALLDLADKALVTDGTNALTKAGDERTASLKDLFEKSNDFVAAGMADAGLEIAAKSVDRVANFWLTAKNNPTGADDKAAPGITAKALLPLAQADEKPEVWFFAVPTAEGVAFDAQTAYKLALDIRTILATGTAAAKKAIVPVAVEASGENFEKKLKSGDVQNVRLCEAKLTVDVHGNPLKWARSYVVYLLRFPADASQLRMDELSFPSSPVVVARRLEFAAQPEILPLGEQGFVVLFQGAAAATYVDSYNVFLAPVSDPDESPDESADVMVGGRLNVSAITPVSTAANCDEHTELLGQQLEKQYFGDLSASTDFVEKKGKSLRADISAIVQQVGKLTPKTADVGVYAVYYNPFATERSEIKNQKYTVGRWADMYGDMIDIARRTYKAQVSASYKPEADETPDAQTVKSRRADDEPSGSDETVVSTDAPTDIPIEQPSDVISNWSQGFTQASAVDATA